MKLRLVVENGERKWVPHEEMVSSGVKRKMNSQNEDLTLDGYIDKYGGIYSNADGKVHTTKGSYMESAKAKGLVIKDWN